MIGDTQREKPGIMQAILTVKEKTFLTPHYIRIVLEGENMEQFAAARLGDNNKIIVPENGDSTIELPDLRRGRGSDGKANSGSRPIIRTYTLRSLDLEKGLMSIDFVSHGENGPASKWAIYAEPGDKLGVLMKVKEKPLFLPAERYLLAGDHTALPVISVILESLPQNAIGKAILEVYGKEDILELKKPEKVDIIWTFNSQPGKTSTLTPYFEEVNFPSDSKFIFVAAEQQAAKEIQESLRSNPNLQRHEWQAYSYWKYGQAEDESANERREHSRNH